MKKIYLIKASNGRIEFIRSAVTSLELAEVVRNYYNETSKNDWKYSIEAVDIVWNNTDKQWLINRTKEAIKQRELPF